MREIDRSREDVKIYIGTDANTECFLYYNTEGKPCAAGYSGKKDKPNFRYRYRDTFHAVNAINEFITAVQDRAESKRLRKIEDKKLQKELFSKIEVGSVFVSSWGYDQTNVDAFQVVEKKGAATVVLREIGLNSIPGSYGFDCCRVIPIKGSFLEKSEPFEKRINRFGVSMSSYSSASLWDGESDYYTSWYA